MRFPIDLVWLDEEGAVREVTRAVPPRRVASCRRATAVIETKSGDADQAAAWATSRRSGIIPPMAQTQQPSPPNRWLEAFNPRVPLYRDTYNEYLVFVVSAIGSVAGTQVPLYLVMALTDLWSVWVFVAACVVFELFVIFFIARPQMKPKERIGWAALWAFATAVLALAFYYLVAEPTL
jgi:VIT1/CCC1 family predicted Fe2+/Mn2+ transporter